MATNKLNLTRDQLATFLKNFEQIKQFEKLFSTTNSSETTAKLALQKAKYNEVLVWLTTP